MSAGPLIAHTWRALRAPAKARKRYDTEVARLVAQTCDGVGHTADSKRKRCVYCGAKL